MITFTEYKKYEKKEHLIFAFYPKQENDKDKENDNKPNILHYLDNFNNNTGLEIIAVSFENNEAEKPCAYFEINIGEKDLEIFHPAIDLNAYINRKIKTLTKVQDLEMENNEMIQEYKDVN